MALTLAEFDLYESQAERIADQVNQANQES